MAETLEKLKVILEASNEPFKKVFRETQQVVRQATASINKESQAAKLPFEGGKQIGNLRLAIRAFVADLKVARGTHIYTDDAKILRADIENADAKAKELASSMRSMELTGRAAEEADAYRELSDELGRTKDQADRARVALANIVQQGGAVKSIGLWQHVKRIASGFAEATKHVARFVSNGIRKAGGTFASLIHRMSDGIGKLRNFGSGLRSAGQRAGGLVSSFLKAGLGLRMLGAAMSWAKNAVKEGFQTMVQADRTGELNQSLSMLMSSLTQLKNSLGAAFAPIVSAVAPALNTLIQLAIQAANAVGQLIATLTGRSTFVAAKKVNQDYAASLNANAAGASGAAKANEQLKRTLLGFDEINKLDDNSASSGGGGGSAGGISPSEMFETVAIDSQIGAFAERIREAWRNSDFTMIGFTISDKLRGALDSINWDAIKEKANRIGASVATFLNGVFEAEGLFDSVGSTAGEALNTALGSLNSFAVNFHWSSLGASISDGINGFFRTTDFKLAADTVSNWGKGILRSIRVGIENTDWRQIGQDVATFIRNIDWSGLASELFRGIGAAVGGLASFIWGLVEDAWDSVVGWWHDNAYEDGQFSIQGLFDGILEALRNVGSWIQTNIFDPFITGFKNAFKISSPSKVFEEQGGFIIDGLLNGLKNNVEAVIEWFRNLPGTIIEKVGDFAVDVRASLTDFKDNIKRSKFISGVTAWFTNTKDKLSGQQKQKGLSGFTAGITDAEDKLSGATKRNRLTGFTAGVTDYTDGISEYQQKKLDGYTADLIASQDDISNKKLTDYTAELTTGQDKINSKTITGFTSVFKTRSFASGYPWTVTGFTSRFDSFSTNYTRTVTGITARYDYVRDNLTANQKTITVTARFASASNLNSVVSRAVGGVYTASGWSPIERYDRGGWPNSAQVFMARENGLPEMVGTIGGHTAVANNGQIVASIAAGVRDAVADVFAAMIGLVNQPEEDSGDIVLYLGDEEVARASRRGEKKLNRQYKIVTE